MSDHGTLGSVAKQSAAMSGARTLIPQAVRSEMSDSRWDTIPRWKIALAIGTPLALGAVASIWYYKSRKSSKTQATEKSAKPTSKNDGKAKSASANATAEKQDPLQQAQSMKNTGNKYFKGGKFDKAIECYTSAIALCPVNSKEDISTFYQNRAAAYEQLKNYDKVIEDCNAALELNSRYVKALSRRAKAYEVKSELALSLDDITAVCILENFGNQHSLLMADRVLKELGRSEAKKKYKDREPQNPSNQFVSNYLSAFANDPILEHKKISEREQSSGDDSEKERLEEMEKDVLKSSPYLRAVEMLRRHEYGEIVKLCTSEIESGSSNIAEALLLRATFYALRGEMESAMADFQRLLDINAISDRVRSNALIKRACVRMQLGDAENALKDFDEAVKCDPQNSDVYHHRGQILLLMGQLDSACKDFAKSSQLCPDTFAVSHVQKCYADIRLAMSGNGTSTKPLDELVQQFEETVKRFPKCAEGYALLGQVLVEMKQYTRADENFKLAQELEPKNGNIYVHRGLLRLQWQQDVDAAAKLINDAIRVEEKCVFAYETLGTIEIQRGCLEKAIDLFNKAINLVKTEDEMTHLYSMLHAAVAQAKVAKHLGIPLPSMM